MESTPSFELSQTDRTAFSADGGLMAVVRHEGLSLYDATTGKEKWRHDIPAESVSSCVISDDGAAIALATKNDITLYAPANGKRTTILKSPGPSKKSKGGAPVARGRDYFRDVVISLDGRWLAAAAGDDEDIVYCWEIKSGKLKLTLKPAARPIGFTPDGAELLTVKDGVGKFWSIAKGSARRIDVPNKDNLILSADGQILAATSEDGIILVDAKTGKQTPHSCDPPGLPGYLSFRGPRRLIGRLGDWGGWVEWDTRRHSSRLIRAAESSGARPIAISLDNQAALYRRGVEYSLIKVATGRQISRFRSAAFNVRDGEAADILPDGRTIVGWDQDWLVLQGSDGARPRNIRHSRIDGQVVGIAVSGDSRYAAVGLTNHFESSIIELFDLVNGRSMRRFGIGGEVTRLLLTPDGEWLAVGYFPRDANGIRFGDSSRQAVLVVYHTTSGKRAATVAKGATGDHVIALSPDGRMLARLEGKQIAIWEVISGNVRARLEAGGAARSLAFAPDCRTLAASVPGDAGVPLGLARRAKAARSQCSKLGPGLE